MPDQTPQTTPEQPPKETEHNPSEPKATATAGRSREEIFNTLTHFVGLCLVPCISWVIIWLGYAKSWQNAFGVTFFTVGMLLMYLASSMYHWWRPGKGKRILRQLDHIGIYVMIACSYTPICMELVEDGRQVGGWVFFGVIWLLVLVGIFYKVFFIDRYPKLSLALYVLMGWSVLFIVKPVWESCTPLALSFILAEGASYTTGVYFFAHDCRPYYHGIWHIFVILGTLFHWAAVWMMI
jgi:hemolysin III